LIIRTSLHEGAENSENESCNKVDKNDFL